MVDVEEDANMKSGKPKKAPKVPNPRPKDNYMKEADTKLTAKAPNKPFLFLNMGTFKKYSTTEKATAVMHETMHMSILLNNWKIMDKEEEAIQFAEDEANKIIEKLGFSTKEQPKKNFFKK